MEEPVLCTMKEFFKTVHTVQTRSCDPPCFFKLPRLLVFQNIYIAEKLFPMNFIFMLGTRSLVSIFRNSVGIWAIRTWPWNTVKMSTIVYV